MSSAHPTSGPRLMPRIKLIWGAGDTIRARWRLGLFGFYDRIHGFPMSGLAISLRGVLAWAAVLVVAGYIGGAALLTRWLQREPHSPVRFVDVLIWPVRRAHMAQLRGRAWLAQGKDALAEQRWGAAVFYLRKGLEVCPDDFDARLTLAQFYILSHERARALALLADGPLYGSPPASWRTAVFAITTAGEDWNTARLICDRCLAQLRPHSADRAEVVAQKCAALVGLGQPAEALALAAAEGDTAATGVKTQRVRAEFEARGPAAALAFLATWRQRATGDDLAVALRLQAEAYRRLQQWAQMEATLVELRAASPASPGPAAFAIEQTARAGRDAMPLLEDYLFRFGGSQANLHVVLQAAAGVPDVRLARRIVAAAAERGYPMRTFRAPLATTLLRAGDFAGAARAAEELAPEMDGASADLRLWYDWIKALTGALQSSSVADQQALEDFMQTRGLSLEVHALTLASLERAGHADTAREVAVRSRRVYPESPTIRAAAERIERHTAMAQAAAPRAEPTPATAPTVNSSWRSFRAALDGAIADARWNDADRLIASLRRENPPPSWLVTHEADILWRGMEIAEGKPDLPALRMNAQRYLDGTSERAAKVIRWAEQLADAGHRDDARVLARLVLVRSPRHPLATALLARLDAEPAAKP